MTLDDQLDFKTVSSPVAMPLVASAAKPRRAPRAASLRLDGVPQDRLLYLVLPQLLTRVGVIENASPSRAVW